MATVAEVAREVGEMRPALAKLNERVEAQGQRMQKIEEEQAEQRRLVLAVERLANGMDSLKEKMADLSDNVKKIDCRMTDVEQKPAKRWDGLVEKVLLTAVAGLVGFLLSKFGI